MFELMRERLAMARGAAAAAAAAAAAEGKVTTQLEMSKLTKCTFQLGCYSLLPVLPGFEVLPTLLLSPQIAYNMATQMAPHPDGTPRVINGVAGVDRKFVELLLQSCIVRNDQAATKPEEMPPPVAIVTLRALLHCQASVAAGRWDACCGKLAVARHCSVDALLWHGCLLHAWS